MAGQYAFNSKLIALEIGETDRVERRLIRVGVTYGGVNAEQTNDVIKNDESGAGLSWSDEELQIGDDGDWANIAVVVGELLVDVEAEVAGSWSQNLIAQTVKSLDPKQHQVIPRGFKKAAIIVAKLDEPIVTFFALAAKSWNGLCEAWWLDESIVDNDYLFFYPEWTTKHHADEESR